MIAIIAWRNIWRNKVRSFTIILSVVIGLLAGTFVNAIYWGMSEDRVKLAIENEISHIQIHHPKFKDDFKAGFTIPLDDSLLNSLKSIPAIKAYSLRTVTHGMLATSTSNTGIQINGIYPEQEKSVTNLDKKITEGEYFPEGKQNAILVGEKLAKKMKLHLKSSLVLTFLEKGDTVVSAKFKVAGIFRTQNSMWDDMNVFVRATELNKNLGLTNETHAVATLLHSNKELKTTVSSLRRDLPNLLVESWDEVSPETGMMMATMSQFSIIFVIIILLALSFGIINTMLMAILERVHEIGMMMALGMNKVRIFFLVLLETFLLVMIGCPIGMFMAWAFIRYFSTHGIDISSFSGKAMSSFGFSSIIYPMLPWSQYIQIISLVALTAFLSSIFPARRALKINPAESIKA